MATFFSDIGFSVETQGEMAALAVRAAELGEHLISPHGEYIVWSPGLGVELWVQVTGGNTIVELNPHFAGVSRTTLGITEWLPEMENPLQGALAGWAGARVGSPAGDAYALTAHVPDFDLHAGQLSVPSVLTVQIAAFAQRITSYTNDEAYFAEQGSRIKMAAEVCLPLGGPLSALGEMSLPGMAPGNVLLSGHVRAVRKLLNPVSALPFFALEVQVQEGRFDVVADAALFDVPPLPGSVIQGAFWLSARVVGLGER